MESMVGLSNEALADRSYSDSVRGTTSNRFKEVKMSNPEWTDPSDFDDPVSDLGFALVRVSSAADLPTIVRITKRSKRFAEVETLHNEADDRMAWRETSRGLWDFPTYSAAHIQLAKLREIERRAV